MPAIVRFAPSPTGRLHVGNIRTALLNWLFARQAGGDFWLRLDDTDLQRSTEEFADGIRRDLEWLGLAWTREERQSARTDRYVAAAEKLKQLRPALCLLRDRGRARPQAQAPARARPAADLRPCRAQAHRAERAALEAEGRKPHWRFRLANSEDGLTPLPTIVSWNDLIRGDQTVDVGSLSDPVVIRADGSFLYTFTSVVDDAEFGITHVIRGEDHVTNTGVQMQLFEALERDPPAFGHHSLLIGADGQALSKRLGALSIESLRESGLEPLALASYTALIGTSDAIEPQREPRRACRALRLRQDLHRAGAFRSRRAEGAQRQAAAYDAVRSASPPASSSAASTAAPAFWSAVRGNLGVLGDAGDWWRIVSGATQPVIEDREVTDKAAALLPEEPWDDTTWDTWIAALKTASGRKGRALFHPLRLALTGREDGPELKLLLPLIGRERAEARLLGRTA